MVALVRYGKPSKHVKGGEQLKSCHSGWRARGKPLAVALLACVVPAAAVLCAVAAPADAAGRPRSDRQTQGHRADRHLHKHVVVRRVKRDGRRDPKPDAGPESGHGSGNDADKGSGGSSTQDVGNGKMNSNMVSTKSPTTNKGMQHTSASTISGATSILNALCKHARVCNITLNVTMAPPEEAKKKVKKVRKAAPAEEECPCEAAEDASFCDS
ncbi:hypothetical protein Ssi03_77290 [Sphaerisporangium siamense]|uniref:Uncharacterized protein n=1 Tax=Sphaerisporangium siamense TaxID=795645 RepID=A0A7W7D649_9ACTN|nr:hypothetical protein [Sphaerisporangium siamense]MBB4700699.1 hypothetical protein [Sphaerisporangium siamense]GII89739.1 hypothetical protein Ssi03_77290 [Sphaerisporangium siamense]